MFRRSTTQLLFPDSPLSSPRNSPIPSFPEDDVENEEEEEDRNPPNHPKLRSSRDWKRTVPLKRVAESMPVASVRKPESTSNTFVTNHHNGDSMAMPGDPSPRKWRPAIPFRRTATSSLMRRYESELVRTPPRVASRRRTSYLRHSSFQRNNSNHNNNSMNMPELEVPNLLRRDEPSSKGTPPMIRLTHSIQDEKEKTETPKNNALVPVDHNVKLRTWFGSRRPRKLITTFNNHKLEQQVTQQQQQPVVVVETKPHSLKPSGTRALEQSTATAASAVIPMQNQPGMQCSSPVMLSFPEEDCPDDERLPLSSKATTAVKDTKKSRKTRDPPPDDFTLLGFILSLSVFCDSSSAWFRDVSCR